MSLALLLPHVLIYFMLLLILPPLTSQFTLISDILKEATHLAKVIASPTASDMAKLVIVIRYCIIQLI
jgi:hypothetical protein